MFKYQGGKAKVRRADYYAFPQFCLLDYSISQVLLHYKSSYQTVLRNTFIIEMDHMIGSCSDLYRAPQGPAVKCLFLHCVSKVILRWGVFLSELIYVCYCCILLRANIWSTYICQLIHFRENK